MKFRYRYQPVTHMSELLEQINRLPPEERFVCVAVLPANPGDLPRTYAIIETPGDSKGRPGTDGRASTSRTKSLRDKDDMNSRAIAAGRTPRRGAP